MIKLECECGNIDHIKSSGIRLFDADCAELESRTFEITGEHAEVWISCNKCGKTLYL